MNDDGSIDGGSDDDGIPQEQVDAAWQEIISGFGETPRMSAANDAPAGPVRGPASTDWDPLADESETYQPPEPPPIPRPHHTVDRFAWTGVLAGPLVVLLAFFLPLPRWLAAVGAIGFAAGFAVLIARKKDTEPDGSDGAVV